MLKVKDLKRLINTADDNTLVYIGLEGYTNYLSDDEINCDTRAFFSDGKLFITDDCKLDGIEEEKPKTSPLQLGLEMSMRIGFNREIRKNDNIDIGSIVLEMNGEDIQLDFEHIIKIKDLKDNSIQSYWGEALDFDTFPDCYKISYTGLKNINEIKKISIKIASEDKNEPLLPVELKSLSFITTYQNPDETNWHSFLVKEDVLKRALFCTDIE